MNLKVSQCAPLSVNHTNTHTISRLACTETVLELRPHWESLKKKKKIFRKVGDFRLIYNQ